MVEIPKSFEPEVLSVEHTVRDGRVVSTTVVRQGIFGPEWETVFESCLGKQINEVLAKRRKQEQETQKTGDNKTSIDSHVECHPDMVVFKAGEVGDAVKKLAREKLAEMNTSSDKTPDKESPKTDNGREYINTWTSPLTREAIEADKNVKESDETQSSDNPGDEPCVIQMDLFDTGEPVTVILPCEPEEYFRQMNDPNSYLSKRSAVIESWLKSAFNNRKGHKEEMIEKGIDIDKIDAKKPNVLVDAINRLPKPNPVNNLDRKALAEILPKFAIAPKKKEYRAVIDDKESPDAKVKTGFKLLQTRKGDIQIPVRLRHYCNWEDFIKSRNCKIVRQNKDTIEILFEFLAKTYLIRLISLTDFAIDNRGGVANRDIDKFYKNNKGCVIIHGDKDDENRTIGELYTVFHFYDD